MVGTGITVAVLFTSSFVGAMEMSATGTDTMMKKDGAMMDKTDSMMKKDSAMMSDHSMMMEDNLWMGSRGGSVTALQTFLESKGFLTLPAGATKGYFGSLTKSALKKYQTMLGVPSTGYFGAMTRAKHNAMSGDTLMKKDGAMMDSMHQ